MFFEQYSHEPYIAVVRYWHHVGIAESRREQGYAALAVMEAQLARHDFFVGGRYSIADIALYAYTHVAHEGGFDLAPYAATRAWLDRVRGQPRHIPITRG
jgi:glutathione S-transferase